MNVSFVREIRREGDIAYVPLTKGYEAIIDAGDIGLVSKWNWMILVGGSGLRYAKRNRLVGDGEGAAVILLHRVIVSPPDGMVVDHVDGDGLNNRRANMRVASQAENTQNRRMRKDNTSGKKGVFWDKFTGKWMAAIGHQGKFHNLGRFDTAAEAGAAYTAAAHDKFGIFARSP